MTGTEWLTGTEGDVAIVWHSMPDKEYTDVLLWLNGNYMTKSLHVVKTRGQIEKTWLIMEVPCRHAREMEDIAKSYNAHGASYAMGLHFRIVITETFVLSAGKHHILLMVQVLEWDDEVGRMTRELLETADLMAREDNDW